MPFAPSGRVTYGKNPLEQVICQLRFPTILRVEAQAPAEFQDAIRRDFPIYEAKTSANVKVSKVLGLQLNLSTTEHQFKSEDETYVVSLAKDFVALTCTAYTKWEEFRGFLQQATEALENFYEPSLYTRLGLRYVDVISKSKLGLDDANWTDLLQPYILGELVREEIQDSILGLTHVLEVDLKETEGRVRVVHGLEKREDETVYKIDADLFVEEKTEKDNAFAQLKEFNRRAARLFRWCITDQLHRAMEPEPIPD